MDFKNYLFYSFSKNTTIVNLRSITVINNCCLVTDFVDTEYTLQQISVS